MLSSARRWPGLPRLAAGNLRAWTPGLRLSTVAATVSARVGAAIFSFGAGIIAARVLGPQGRGLLAVLIAVPGVIGILGLLGQDTANLRFAGRSHSAFRQVVRRAVLFSLAAGSAIGAGWWLAGLLWPPVRLGLDPRLALMCALLCPPSLLLSLLGTAEVGRGRTAVYNLVMAATTAIYLAEVIALQLAGQLTVAACFAAYAASLLLCAAALLLLATKRVHPDGESIPLRQYSGYALRAYLPNVVQYGMLRMDVPLIQVLAGTTAVALYAVALPFAEALLLLPVAVGLVLFPQVTSGAVDKAAVGRIRIAVLGATAALAGGIAVTVPVLVPHLYGSAFRGSVTVLWCMLPGLVVFSIARTTQTYLAGTDNLRPVVVASVAGLAAGLITLLVLTTRLGAVGAAIADSAAYAVFAAIILVRRPTQERLACAVKLALVRFCRSGWSLVERAAAQFSNVRATLLGLGALAIAVAAAVLSTRSIADITAVLGILLLLVIVARPDTGLYILAIALPVSQTSAGIRLVTDKDLLVLVLVCMTGRLAAGGIARQQTRAVALGVVLTCYFLVSMTLVGGTASGQNLRGLLTLSAVLLSLPLIANGDKVTRHAAIAFAFSAACVALAEIPASRSSVAASGNIAAANSAAVAATQTGALNHNTEGAFFVLALCVLLARYAGIRHRLGRLGVAVAIAALIAGVAYSYSRASYFGAIAVIAVYAARRSIHELIATGVVTGCLLPFVPGTVLARMGTIWNSNSLGDSSATRLDLWRSAIHMFAHSPILGIGYLHFSVLLPVYYVNTSAFNVNTVNFSTLAYAHNTYLTVLAQTGLIGTVLVAALITVGWRIAASAARAGDWAGESALLAFIGMAMCSAFGEPLFQAAVLAAFLLVLLAARHTKEARHAGPDSRSAGLASGSTGITDARQAAANSASGGHSGGRRLVLPAGHRTGPAGPYHPGRAAGTRAAG